MEKLKIGLEYSLCREDETEKMPVIVVAAGNALRMGGINKQTLLLYGKPVIARTLCALAESQSVSRIILVTKEQDILKMQSICEEYGIDKVSDIVKGGNDRHESVLCGIKMLSKDEDKVLIHDGARPFVTPVMISDCIKALESHTGCLCAVKVSDTVKRANGDGTVSETVDRSDLFLAQTPQGVRVKEYIKASDEYKNIGFTDDASVLEAAGYSVKIVSGGKNNIKITTPEDIKIAEGIIERENL